MALIKVDRATGAVQWAKESTCGVAFELSKGNTPDAKINSGNQNIYISNLQTGTTYVCILRYDSSGTNIARYQLSMFANAVDNFELVPIPYSTAMIGVGIGESTRTLGMMVLYEDLTWNTQTFTAHSG